MMKRRTLVLSTGVTVATALLPAAFAGFPAASARKRRRRRSGSAAATASASVSGPNGGTSVIVDCNGEHEEERDPSSSQVSCRD